MKLAYADLYHYNADPRFAKFPVSGLLSDAYAQSAPSHRSRQANCNPGAGPFPAVTPHIFPWWIKTAISFHWIQSDYSRLRFRRRRRRHGLHHAESRARCSRSIRTIPMCSLGGKRPFHTIIPAFMERGDQHIGFGIMGGANQPLAHAQFASKSSTTE